MKLSTKSRYGLRAMIEIARRAKDGPVKRKDIRDAQDISNAYLENILITLKKASLIRTTRGARGGYILDREPSDITAYQIVAALEGSIAPVECLNNPSICQRYEQCVARNVWQRLYDAEINALDSMSLQDMLDMETESAGLIYAI